MAQVSLRGVRKSYGPLEVIHGIDMEIEFMSDAGEATGQKLYLQLASGDSHLTRRHGLEGHQYEVFAIDDEHARYWVDERVPVMVVVHRSTGDVVWMEVSEQLRRERAGGGKAMREIVFTGERFDVMSVRRWRDRALGPAGGPG